MKQIAQKQNQGCIEVLDVPWPALRPMGVLVRTEYSLISAGTERAKVELARKTLAGKALARPEQARLVLESVRQQGLLPACRKVANRLGAWQPLGYSCSGTVIAVGEGVREFEVGDRVACAGAGYANHAAINCVPRNLCVQVPSGVGLDEAAFATVGAIAMQGVHQAEARLGETIAVIGLGLIGLLTVQILKAAGCCVIGVDTNAERCRLARRLGVEEAAAPDFSELFQLAPSLAGVPGCDAVIITAAAPSDDPIILAGRLCRDRGRVSVVGNTGMNVPRQIYYDKELSLYLSRSYGPGRYDTEYEEKGADYPIAYVRWTENRNMQAFLQLIASGKLDARALITHRFQVDRAGEAYRLITKDGESHLGVLLEYPETASARMEPTAIGRHTPVWKSYRTQTSDYQPGEPGQSPAAGSVACPALGSFDGGRRVTIGLIGAGNFAQDTLLPALRADDNLRLGAVATASGLSAISVAHRFGFEAVAENAGEILANPKIDAIVIATRHDSHAGLVIEGLKAGKHVFVEKPLAITRKQLKKIRDTYEGLSSPPILMVGFNRRFAPASRALKEFFKRGREPLSLRCRVNAGYVPAGHWLHDSAIGGGRIIGEGCHFLDLLIWLAGCAPTSIFAQALPDAGRYHQDNVSVQLRFQNGSIGTLDYLANGDKRAGKEYIEVFGSGATCFIDDFVRTRLYRSGRIRRIGHWWSAQDKGHRAEVRAFLDAVRNGGFSPVPFEEAALSMEAAFLVLDSLKSGAPLAFEIPRQRKEAADIFANV